MWYRAYLLGPNYSITAVEEFGAEHDIDAVTRVNGLALAGSEFAGFELWQEERPVMLYPKSKALRGIWPPRNGRTAPAAWDIRP